MKKALITETRLSKDHEERLKKMEVEVKYASGDLNEEQLIKELQGCQIYVIGGADTASKKVIESTDLELIVFWGTGWESYVDIEAANKKGVKVANTPHANAYTVAEHTVALILDAVKQITHLNNTTRKGEWIRRQTWNLEGKTLGIVGMGHIGSSVAKIMNKGFGMKVIYYSRSERPEVEKELGARKVDLMTLLTNSDVISLHTPLTEETKYLIGKSELEAMKATAVLINCTRADVVEPEPLKEALENKRIACAAFDTYYQEPSPKTSDDKWGLMKLTEEKFILTPHTAYGSKEAVEKTNEMAVENIEDYINSKTPRYTVQS